MMNQQKAKDLNRRMGVSESVLNLLRRAKGLDVMSMDEGVVEVLHERPFGQRLTPYEKSAGVALNADNEPVHHVLVTEDVEYPVAGYPEAYNAPGYLSVGEFNGDR